MSLESRRAILESTQARMREEVRNALEDELQGLRERSAQDLLRELGIKGFNVKDLPLDWFDREWEEMLDLLTDEVVNRTTGYVMEQRLANHDDDQDKASKAAILAVSTMATIAGKATSKAVNSGREAVIDLIVKVEAGEVMATRSAVLDKATCGPCAELHGSSWVYGSPGYHANKPPAKCLGRSACRCVVLYSLPLDIIAD